VKPWYILPEGRSRLARDRLVVKHYAPDLAFGALTGKLQLKGNVQITAASSGIIRSIGTLIIFPDLYPRHSPKAFVERGKFEPQTARRHFRGDNSCCLWFNRADDGWNGELSGTIEHFMQQLLVFYDRQLTFDAIGEFPGPAWPHDRPIAELYLESYLTDRKVIEAFGQFRAGRYSAISELCPCGRDALFGDCHRGVFVDLQRRLSGSNFSSKDLEMLERKEEEH